MAFTVLDATFERSAPSLKACDEGPSDLIEIAFAGRSNVGKSSLIAELVGQKKLVRTSKTPGATKDLNFFQVRLRHDALDETRTFRLVDLPGYGWARVSQKQRLRLSALIGGYLSTREPLKGVCQLFDVRHKPTEDDRRLATQLSSFLEERGGRRELALQHLLVATKADKLGRAKRKPARKTLADLLERPPGDVTLFSSTEHLGRDELLGRVWTVLVGREGR